MKRKRGLNITYKYEFFDMLFVVVLEGNEDALREGDWDGPRE